MIPSDQVDDPAAMAIAAGYVGCIERVSNYSVCFMFGTLTECSCI